MSTSSFQITTMLQELLERSERGIRCGVHRKGPHLKCALPLGSTTTWAHAKVKDSLCVIPMFTMKAKCKRETFTLTGG